MVEVTLAAVKVDLRSKSPVILLQEVTAPGRTLPIFIGSVEATSIEYAARGIETPRPLTHDLMRDIFDALGVEILRVIVTELKDGTYYAELVLVSNKTPNVVSCRPSDAIALAVRVGATIYVADELMNTEGLVLLEEDEEDDEDGVDGQESEEEIVDDFKEFLDTLKPEDFS
jgi:bifunctional DNase/RNase